MVVDTNSCHNLRVDELLLDFRLKMLAAANKHLKALLNQIIVKTFSVVAPCGTYNSKCMWTKTNKQKALANLIPNAFDEIT